MPQPVTSAADFRTESLKWMAIVAIEPFLIAVETEATVTGGGMFTAGDETVIDTLWLAESAGLPVSVTRTTSENFPGVVAT